MPRKAAPAPVGDRSYRRAVDLFEKAVKAFGRKDLDRARTHLDTLIETHSEQSDLVERARSYLAMCDRADGPKVPRPRTFEELLNYGVVLHNRGEHAEAARYLQQAVEKDPRNEHALYCLAAARARAGETGPAVEALRAAVQINPTSRNQARQDPDFEALRGDEGFAALVAASLS